MASEFSNNSAAATGTQSARDSEYLSSVTQAQNSRDNRTIANVDPNDYSVELKYRSVKDVGAEKLATGLGWFSIALGLAELLAPKQLGEFIGVGDDHQVLLPALGLREIASGVGILSNDRPAGWVWSRVAGDAMDLAFLGGALLSKNTEKGKVLGATAAVLGVAALDYYCAQMLSEELSQPENDLITPTTVGQPSGRQTVNG